jgi:DNA-binding winged helix-turn-helix (wHTH) protein/Tfp pilus assembly protein PilF
MLLRKTGDLTRGTTRMRLQGQPLEVLEALLEQPGELVTREQLIARLWPRGVVVDYDTALNSAIRRLRTALDDHADHPRYIETIPRRGYRFVASVDAPEPAPIHDPVPMAVAAPTQLASATDAAPANARLRRGWLGLALAAVLMLAVAGGWLARQDRLAPSAVPMPGIGVANVPTEALERYERGRFFFGRRAAGDTARALELYQQALRIAPDFAPAWAGIASVRWIDTMERRMARAEGVPLVRQAAERALTIDPANAEALLRLANYYMASGNQSAAEEAIGRAAAVAPNEPLVLGFQSSRAFGEGRLEEALALQRRAVLNDPIAVTPRHNLVTLLFVAGRYDEARAQFRELSAISPPRFPPDTVIGQSLLLSGDAAGALRYAQTLPTGVVREQLEALSYFALGRLKEADAALQRLAANPSKSTAYRVAEVHAYRGETDAAFAALRLAVEVDMHDCPQGECWPESWVAVLPLLRTLHGDPRWPAILTALIEAPARPRRS